MARPRFALLRPTDDDVKLFFFTREPNNPWRCSACRLASHRRSFDRSVPILKVEEVLAMGVGLPETCRVCGMPYGDEPLATPRKVPVLRHRLQRSS